jgi:hypothetical protein
MAKFPKKIFVTIEEEGTEEEFLEVNKSLESATGIKGGIVATYELKEVQTVHWEPIIKIIGK